MTELLPIALILIAAGAACYLLGLSHGKDDGYRHARQEYDKHLPSLLIRAKQEGVQAQRRAQEHALKSSWSEMWMERQDEKVDIIKPSETQIATAIIEAETKL